MRWSRRWLFLVVGLGILAVLILSTDWSPHPAPTTTAVYQGTVRDDNGPLADALVRLQTTDRFTHTESDGRFRLRTDATGQRLTAWKEGYFIGGTALDATPLDIRLTPLPGHDHDTYEWIDPAPEPGAAHNCANCHADIYQEWSGSAHARSATGKHFLNLYKGTDWNDKPHVGWSLLDEHPLGAGVCAACHAPAIPAGDPAQLDLLEVRGTAAKGVHCDYCHKIADVDKGTLGLTHGRFNLKLLRPGADAENTVHQLTFGPLDDVDRGDDTYSPLYRESRYCASCHEGTVFGVPVYTTYSEWLDSPARQAGKQCQTCHMRPTGTLANIAPGHGGRERNPETLGNHRFFAPNKEEMLRQAVNVAARLERQENQAHVTVRVGAGEVGHQVPTGFVDRHLVVIVDGLDAAGKPVQAVAGPTLPAFAGPEAGLPGRVYAKLLTDARGRGPVPFWRDDAKVTDNRLTPGRTDELAFDFPGELSAVRVRVLYRRFWPEVARSKHWPSADVTVTERTFSADEKP
jgi:Cytochrome c554 and c-prime